MDTILTVAARTPDHGRLAPWRFVRVGADQRDRFAELLRIALGEEQPDAPPLRYEKAETFAHQGAALVVLISAPIRNHKIPVWEQHLSCGAAGMNLLHAAHALGYVGCWLTGWQACSPKVSEAFCKEGESIAGFIFIGTPGRELEERPRPELADVAQDWIAPSSD